MAPVLPKYHVKTNLRRETLPRKFLSYRIIIPLCLVVYLLLRTKHTKETVSSSFFEPSQHQPFDQAHTSPEPSTDALGLAQTNEQQHIDTETEEDIFSKAPRRPLEWSPRLQKLIEKGAEQETKAQQRQLEGKNRPPGVTSQRWFRAFPDYEEYAKLVAKVPTLPDLVMIPIVEAVQNDILHGWEHEWIADGVYATDRWGKLKEPKIDFIYTWVNGSEEAFQNTKSPYERNSTLNDAEGAWLTGHGSNRYRDWDELRYSIRSVEANAPFKNKIQLLVNAVMQNDIGEPSKQEPIWLTQDIKARKDFEVLPQQDFFDEDKQGCLPSFNSLTIENMIHNIPSNVDRVFALSDDMLLGKPHAASDIYSPLFGPMMGFKTNSYSTKSRPTEADAQRFGEKPWLIYTSWLLNRRFGQRKRKGMAHFGHSLSRKVMGEAMESFPGPELQSACSRFRGDFQFQLYSWYVTFHYTIERHREALLWSYIMVRADRDGDEHLTWSEREVVLRELQEGLGNEAKSSHRMRNFYELPEILEAAGLEPPMVNFDIIWTSLDGPVTTKDIDCFNFDINECLAPGFTVQSVNESLRNPIFSTATIFDRVSRQQPECGDCLIKILLHRVQRGLSPLLPDPKTQAKEYEIAIKALIRYQYTVMDPDGLFVMVTDAEQVESNLIKRFKKAEKLVGQLCLNDDVSTTDELELEELRTAMKAMYTQLFPKPSSFERKK